MDDISRRIIDGAFALANAAESGFVEDVQENARAHEQPEAGLAAGQQHGLTIPYDGIVAGEDAADPIAERVLLYKSKAIDA